MIKRESYHKLKSEKARQPKCPEEKERAIRVALEHFNLHLGHFDQDSDQDMTKIILAFCKEPHSAKKIIDYIKIADRSFFRRHYLNPMIKSGQIKMTIPDKPKSGNQKYYAHSN